MAIFHFHPQSLRHHFEASLYLSLMLQSQNEENKEHEKAPSPLSLKFQKKISFFLQKENKLPVPFPSIFAIHVWIYLASYKTKKKVIVKGEATLCEGAIPSFSVKKLLFFAPVPWGPFCSHFSVVIDCKMEVLWVGNGLFNPEVQKWPVGQNLVHIDYLSRTKWNPKVLLTEITWLKLLRLSVLLSQQWFEEAADTKKK